MFKIAGSDVETGGSNYDAFGQYDSTQNTFPAFVGSESPNRDSWVGGFSERRVCNDGGLFPRALAVLGPFCCGIEEEWAATPPVGGTNRWCRTAVRRCGAESALACTWRHRGRHFSKMVVIISNTWIIYWLNGVSCAYGLNSTTPQCLWLVFN